jgi:hypothetical protein
LGNYIESLANTFSFTANGHWQNLFQGDPMAGGLIDATRAGKYGSVFQEAADRFMSLFEDEPWQLSGFESPHWGLSVEATLLVQTKLTTEEGREWYSLSTVGRSATMADDIFKVMETARQSYLTKPDLWSATTPSDPRPPFHKDC